jgi:Tol biopolymer transport system component
LLEEEQIGGLGDPGRVAASCIATVAAVAFDAGATAAPASRSSGVALLTYVEVRGGLCAVRADGSHRVRLLSSRPAIHAPTWSAGRYVAFVGAVSHQIKIFVADSRGRVRWHIDAAHHAQRAWWSPDGRHIAYVFVGPYSEGLAVARPDGSDDHVLASSPPPWPPNGPEDAAWTADGKRLAFTDGGSTEVPQGIYSVSVDGGDRRLLVAQSSSPAFSPDGSKLAYVAVSGGIYIADANGSNPRALTVSKDDIAPTWSPNGKRVAFLRGDAIVVANPDGSNEPRVSASAARSAPVWSPDSKLIAFRRGPTSIVGNRPFTSLIVVARADGGGERVILRRRSTVFVQDPAWRPAAALPRANRRSCASPS